MCNNKDKSKRKKIINIDHHLGIIKSSNCPLNAKDVIFITKDKKIIQGNIDFLLKVSRILRRIPFIGKLLARVIPVADYSTILPLSEKQIREWAILDTFDWLTPTYDNPQTRKTIHKWLIEFGFEKIQVLKEGHIVGRGNKL